MEQTANTWLYCPQFPAASESFIVRQAEALEATVCTELFDRQIPVVDRIRVIELPGSQPQLERSRWRRKSRLLWHAIRYGNTELMPAEAAAAFGRMLSDARPAVLLAQYGTVGLRLMGPCEKARVPLVVHFHGFDLSRKFRDPWYRFSCRQLVRVAHALVVVNGVQRERLLRLGARPEKVHVIPCGVPVTEFSPSEQVAERPCRFLAVGRFVPKKCPENTIRAFAQCGGQHPDVQLTMIGDGPLLGECQRLAGELKVAQQIRFLGSQPIETVNREMRAAGVFLQHSITSAEGDEEGWPVAVGEAMACGLPVISTRHPGIVDQVVESQTGFLVDEGDWKAMADRMVELIENADLRRSLGAAGRRRIERIGDVADSLRRLKEVLEAVAV